MSKKLLAAFGGGCQMQNGAWVPTPAFEIWPLGKDKGRSLTVQPEDDDDPNSVIAMGRQILEATILLDHVHNFTKVAIAYGDSSPSLKLAGHPSENQVMSDLFDQDTATEKTEIFNPNDWGGGNEFSGTYNEARNLLRLVQRDGFDEVHVLCRGAHLRAMVCIMVHLNEDEFADLKDKILSGELRIVPHTVEDVLSVRPSNLEILQKIRNSKSYQRFLLREGNWIMNWQRKGGTQLIQAPQTATASTAK